MKSIMKKVIAVFAVLCVVTTTFASCSKSGESSESSEQPTLSQEEIEGLMRQPLYIGKEGDDEDIASDSQVDLEADDPVEQETTTTTAVATTKTANIAPVTTIQTVTDADGQAVTTVVEATDANGDVQTDAQNQPVTEVVPVTEVITVTTEATEEETTESATESYTSKTEGRYAMWLDVSQDADFFFENDMLAVTFKVKENIPDGDYKVRIEPDLAQNPGVTVYPEKVLEGTVRVNNGTIEPIDVSGETGLVMYGENIACKQGDEITFHINIKNNPGLVAFNIWFRFDGNAFEFVDAKACGEYEEIAKQTDIG